MTRKNKKSIWIDKKLHGWFKQFALDQSVINDRIISLEEIINDALKNYKFMREEDQKK